MLGSCCSACCAICWTCSGDTRAACCGVTADAPALKLVSFQSDIAAERVVEVGGNVSEVERFIADQTQLLTVTEVEGYGVIDPNASRILNINA